MRLMCDRAGPGIQVSLTPYFTLSIGPHSRWHRCDRSQHSALKSEGFWAKEGVVSLSLCGVGSPGQCSGRQLFCSLSGSPLSHSPPFISCPASNSHITGGKAPLKADCSAAGQQPGLSQHLASRAGFLELIRTDMYQPQKARRKDTLVLIQKRRKWALWWSVTLSLYIFN